MPAQPGQENGVPVRVKTQRSDLTPSGRLQSAPCLAPHTRGSGSGPYSGGRPQGPTSGVLPFGPYLGGELDVRPGTVLEQQLHPVHVPGLHREEQDLHGHAAQVGVSASVQQAVDGQPPVSVSGRISVTCHRLEEAQDTITSPCHGVSECSSREAGVLSCAGRR